LSNQNENIVMRRDGKNHAIPSQRSGYANVTYRRTLAVRLC